MLEALAAVSAIALGAIDAGLLGARGMRGAAERETMIGRVWEPPNGGMNVGDEFFHHKGEVSEVVAFFIET